MILLSGTISQIPPRAARVSARSRWRAESGTYAAQLSRACFFSQMSKIYAFAHSRFWARHFHPLGPKAANLPRPSEAGWDHAFALATRQGGLSSGRCAVSFAEDKTISVSVRSTPGTPLTIALRKASRSRVVCVRTFNR
jgi:hypothetical protein